MDTKAPEGEERLSVDEQITLIKRRMPSVYTAIRAKEAEIGREAFALVRRGARGEPRCFYAFEGGHAVGTPFDVDVPNDLAQLVARFGVTYLCVWPESAAKGGNGAN